MIPVARTAVLHLRTVAPYRTQGLLVLTLMMLILARSPDHVVPALAVLLAPPIAVHPFVVSDKAGLETLYAILPVPRRTVVLGNYAWALASFLATVAAGTALAAGLAQAEGIPFAGHRLVTMLGLSWVLFAVNIAVQFPLLLRYGYARISVLGTTVPLALVMLAVVRLHLSVANIQAWMPFVWVGGAAVIAVSAALAARAPGPRT